MEPEQQLLVALRFFASGSMQLVVGDAINMSQPTVSRIIPRVCDAIIANLRENVKMPGTAEECRLTSSKFNQIANLPFVIGAIDCTHVKIQSPGGNNGELFRNRKGHFSINVQTISDPNLRIMDVVARWPGSTHDQTIFINSSIHQRFERGDFGRYFLIGDSGYGNTRFLATPFTAANVNMRMDRAAQNYNRSIISTRNVVERQYGLWKRRFPALAYGLRLKTVNCQKVIVACAVLHNLAIDSREPGPVEEENINDIVQMDENDVPLDQIVADNPRRRGIQTARDRVIHIFRERLRMQE